MNSQPFSQTYHWNGVITTTTDEIRLYDYFRKRLKWSRRFLRRLREDGQITLNGESVPYLNVILRIHDRIEVKWHESHGSTDEISETNELDMPTLHVLHEDEDLIVINKPSGFLVHPVRHQRGNTIQEALIHRLGGEKVQPVHRLDRETSGVLLFARHAMAQQQLSEQFKKKTVRKTYLAIGMGWAAHDVEEVHLPIAVDPNQPSWRIIDASGQSASTEFRCVKWGYWRGHAVTLFAVQPFTGRTHQIRIHAQAIGHPLLGDEVYGGEACRALSERVCLHAYSLAVKHPRTGLDIEWRQDMPMEWENELM